MTKRVTKKNNVKKNAYKPYSIEWYCIMESVSYDGQPLQTVRIGKVRKCYWNVENLEK
jgi:hypothetical protein